MTFTKEGFYFLYFSVNNDLQYTQPCSFLVHQDTQNKFVYIFKQMFLKKEIQDYNGRLF